MPVARCAVLTCGNLAQGSAPGKIFVARGGKGDERVSHRSVKTHLNAQYPLSRLSDSLGLASETPNNCRA